jgi:hypothetical protein
VNIIKLRIGIIKKLNGASTKALNLKEKKKDSLYNKLK